MHHTQFLAFRIRTFNLGINSFNYSSFLKYVGLIIFCFSITLQVIEEIS